MHPDDTLTIPAGFGPEPIELLFMPQPIEAWTLEDFADLALVPSNDSDSD